MASFQKHKAKNGALSWRAQLSINGIRDSKGGFDSKSSAKIWTATREAQILSDSSAVAPSENQIPPIPIIASKTLADLFEHYAKEVSPSKVGYRWEKIRLYKLCRYPFAKTSLLDLGPEHLAR